MTRIGNDPNIFRVVDAAGLPGWSVAELDALLGAGLLAPDALDHLTTLELLEVARRSVRASRNAPDISDIAPRPTSSTGGRGAHRA